jgi:hypothetical protein
MENFFNWIAKPLPNDEVIIWFNVHNMLYERIELYGDIFKTLHHIIRDTYMGDDFDAPAETKISISKKDQELHFDWCWKKMISDFKKENVIITEVGEHKDYLESFYVDTFYNQSEARVKNSIPKFVNEIFDVFKPFSKSDLDMITELYKLLEKNVK